MVAGGLDAAAVPLFLVAAVLAGMLFFGCGNPPFDCAKAGVVAKLNPATATISDDAIKAIVLVLKLLMFSFSSLVML